MGWVKDLQVFLVEYESQLACIKGVCAFDTKLGGGGKLRVSHNDSGLAGGGKRPCWSQSEMTGRWRRQEGTSPLLSEIIQIECGSQLEPFVRGNEMCCDEYK